MTRYFLPSLLLWGTATLSAAEAPSASEFFEKRVRPVLAEHCYTCHGPVKQRSGLRLDSRAAILQGGDSGKVVTPGNPDQSPFIKALHYNGDLKMPPKNKLPAEAIEALTAWVKMGLPWPDSSPMTATATASTSIADARRSHWAFQPMRKVVPPITDGDSWSRTPIDRFILATLRTKGLQPSPAADRRTLIRRASFDLVGLPPAPNEVEAFVRDRSPDAWERVIDRLLASPAYGERWGRHWLDVARYADTKGYVFQEERRYPYSYTYRDYVIRAFNEDLPYDRFILEQLAADRLVSGDDKRPLAAMGFLTLGRRFLNNTHDIIDDRIDVVTRGLMGMTMQCARCHDHKFDPLPSADYYSLYGIFASSIEPKDLPQIGDAASTPASAEFARELARLQKAVSEFEEANREALKNRDRKARNDLRDLQAKVDRLKVTHPGAPASAMVLIDAAQPTQPVVFLRGNPNNRGPSVPRQFLAVLSGDERKPFREGSGRLELARSIADPKNPLTARVLVNRVWMHHFGEGLVRTPGDFGLRGEPPTHPELLDWLAVEFVENGWSIKHLHRLMLSSAVYQQRSDTPPHVARTDPDNRWLSHMNRQRLEFEPLRDALLAVAGRLDPTPGGVAVDILKTPFSTRRTVYGFVDRQNLPGLFRTFDLASPDTSTSERHATTVPQQALYLMNAPFVVEQARHLLKRPEVAAVEGAERIVLLHHLLYGRPADVEEVKLGLRFVTQPVDNSLPREREGEAPAKPQTAGKSGSAGASPSQTASSHITPTKGARLTTWEKYTQVLLLANEFTFID